MVSGKVALSPGSQGNGMQQFRPNQLPGRLRARSSLLDDLHHVLIFQLVLPPHALWPVLC